MKKSLLTWSVAAALGFSGIIISIPDKANASKLEDLKEQQNNIQEKRSDVNSKINNGKNEIDRLQDEQMKVETQIESLNMKISETEQKIVEKKGQVEDTKEKISKLREEIKVLEERIAKRNELLKDRARSFQENGSMVSYIDVLMGSQSFSDFIDRVGAVATIVEADQSILREHQADKELLQKTKAEVESKLAELQNMVSELEGMQANLNTQKSQKDQLMAQLKDKEKAKEAEVMDLSETEDLLAAQEAAMQKAIANEKQRLAEVARQQAEAAKRSSSSGSGSSGGGASVSAPPVSSGSFTRPAAGSITSGLGMRWGSYHAGIDIAAGGTVPIVAAADGVVIRSYRSGSYGEAVFISHSINGQIYTTVYGHMRAGSRAVNEGQVVKKGQFIGYMGNTGDSTGQHLHFELHRGPWNLAKSNAIDPRGIVPF